MIKFALTLLIDMPMFCFANASAKQSNLNQASNSITWQAAKGPYGGSFDSVILSKQNPQLMFLKASKKIYYKSDNAGQSCSTANNVFGQNANAYLNATNGKLLVATINAGVYFTKI